MEEDGNGGSGGVGTFVTRVEFNEYKQHQDTRHDTLCDKIDSMGDKIDAKGEAQRLAVWYVGAITGFLILASMFLQYFEVI